MIAVIGGSGLLGISEESSTTEEVVDTPYGKPSSALKISKLNGIEIDFLIVSITLSLGVDI